MGSGFVAAALVAALSGCVSVHSTVARTATPTAAAGYVAGIFSTSSGHAFGLGLVDTRTGQDYVMPFGEPSSLPSERTNQVSMIDLPPGEYRIAYWTTFATLTHERTSKSDLPAGHPLARSFRVEPEKVVLIGSLVAETEQSGRKIEWTISSRRVPASQAADAFRQAYPGFAAAAASCLLCTADPAERREVAAPAPAARPVAEAAAPAAAPAGAPALDDVTRLPYASAKMVERYRVFLKRPSPRAFAISEHGSWWMAWNGEPVDATRPKDAAQRALQGCEEASRARCFLYAVDDRVVWRPDRAR